MQTHLIPPFIMQQYEQDRLHGQFGAASLFVDISGFSQVTNTFLEHGSEAVEVMASVMRNIWDPAGRCRLCGRRLHRGLRW